MRVLPGVCLSMVCAAGVALAGCGGGSGGVALLEEPRALTGIDPAGPIPSETATEVTVTGVGLGPVGAACTLRVTARGGTPFDLGSAATLEGDLEVLDEQTLAGSLPAARVRPGSGEVLADVEVVMPDGGVLGLDDAGMRFAELIYALVLDSVSPGEGATTGGELVRIDGAGFVLHDPGLPQVFFGEWPAAGVQLQGDSTLVCVTPVALTGPVDVRVVNDYAEAVLPQAFTFFWTPAWDADYGEALFQISEDVHLFYHDLLARDFAFPFYGTPCGRVALYCGWLSLFDAVDDHWLGDVYPLGHCLDTLGEVPAVHLKQMPDRTVVTYVQVGWAHGEEGSATCQVTFHESGAFSILWREVVPPEVLLVSVFPAAHEGGDVAVDWSLEPADPDARGMFESFGALDPFDLQDQGLLFEPWGDGYATTLLAPQVAAP